MSKKILIVEDVPEICSILSDRAKFHNMEAKVVGTGEAALEIVPEYQPDLILLDLMLPKLSGLGVLRELKREEQSGKIPVIVLSALSHEDVVREAMNEGAKAYFVKTGNMSDLFRLINEYT